MSEVSEVGLTMGMKLRGVWCLKPPSVYGPVEDGITWLLKPCKTLNLGHGAAMAAEKLEPGFRVTINDGPDGCKCGTLLPFHFVAPVFGARLLAHSLPWQ